MISASAVTTKIAKHYGKSFEMIERFKTMLERMASLVHEWDSRFGLETKAINEINSRDDFVLWWLKTLPNTLTAQSPPNKLMSAQNICHVIDIEINTFNGVIDKILNYFMALALNEVTNVTNRKNKNAFWNKKKPKEKR